MGNTASTIISNINSGLYDSTFKTLYVDEVLIFKEKERYKTALSEFIKIYGDIEAEIYSAPGRSEIGGNHTDHQRGKVLATSVNVDIIAVVSPTDDNKVYLKSEGYDAITIDLENLDIDPALFDTTAALVKGVAYGIKSRGFTIGGFKAYVTSQVLTGSGLSSSAAIEILLGQIFSGLYNQQKLDAVTLAIIGQEAENNFFGKPSGLEDQMASSVGGLVHIDFKDASNPKVTKVDVDFEAFRHSLCIVNTKGSHADLTDDYAKIPAEMKAVAQYFGKSVLSEVDSKDFYNNLPKIREKVSDRSILRAIHFFDETERADKIRDSLLSSDFPAFKHYIKESGESSYKYLQNVYSAKRPQDQSIPIGLIMSKKILGEDCACRIHGGGFAGTILVFVPNDQIAHYKEQIEAIFGADSCQVLHIRNIGGCKVL